MNIYELFKKGVDAKNQGRYMEANNIYEEIANIMQKENSVSVRDKASIIWEFARLNYIFGDYKITLGMYANAYNMLNALENKDLQDATFLERMANEYKFVKESLEYFEQDKLYPGYKEFRSRIDPFYKEHGDFDMILAEFLMTFFKSENMVFEKAKGTQITNNSFDLEFVNQNFELTINYEKERVEEGKFIHGTQIRIVKLVIRGEYQGKGLSVKLLNALYLFGQPNKETVWLGGVLNKSWCEYLVKRGMKVMVEASQTKGAYLKMLKLLPARNPKIKMWTIQKRAIVDRVLKTGSYQPINEKSKFVLENPELFELYQFMTNSFEKLNNIEVQGLIFGFLKSDGEKISSFTTYDEFKEFMMSKSNCIKTLWKKLLEDDVVVLELEYERTFNPIHIDANDFNYLIPPVMLVPPYDENAEEKLRRCIIEGKILKSPFPSYIIHAHAPYINKENIIKVHPIFDI